MDGYPPIGDHGIIGDCRTAALISRDGSLDWLCLPRFDSPSFFARILDRRKGGHFSVRPEGEFATERRYLPGTNVLETTFRTDGGVLRLTDFMPAASEEEKERHLWPQHQVLRILDCVEGRVDVRVVCAPRPDYGRVEPRLEERGWGGFVYQHRGAVLILSSDATMRRGPDGHTVEGRLSLEAGERRHLSLTYTRGEPAVLPAFGRSAETKLDLTVSWWRSWVGQLEYDGPFRNAVERSALTLKLLTYAPSGAVVAAPTTSLPELLGGERNWDYRYCWLRDASMTLRSLFDLGFRKEGDAFLYWLLHATSLSWPRLHPLYDVYGGLRMPERTLDHLEGYAGSRPVRVGNAARKQLQLDVYGDLVDGVHEYTLRGGLIDASAGKDLVDLGREVCKRWTEPDEGIWEIRSEPRHHTYSKVMCWVALDRLIKLHRAGHLEAPVERFREERDRIRSVVEERGYREDLQSYVGVFGEDHVDASLYLLQRYGYADPASPRMTGTCRRIQEELGHGPLIHRYLSKDDGLPPGEAAFGICSFWGVECLCRQGETERAHEWFRELLGYANDLGLYGEEIDASTGGQLGNFPQAFTHVGLIDAALTLAECMGDGAPIRRPTDEVATEPEAA